MMRSAFTLIELLVVVAIISVLLALLMPALDRAVYEAELAVCAAGKHALGVGVTAYAMDNKRSYPYRQAVHETPNGVFGGGSGAGTGAQGAIFGAWPGNISLGQPQYDDRPKLRGYMSLNGALNCPLIPKIDIENSHADSYVFATYNLWFGFRYNQRGQWQPGMLRLGDRMVWEDDVSGYKLSSTLLGSTRYIVTGNYGDTTSASHPDDAGAYTISKLQDQNITGGSVGGGVTMMDVKYTVVRWDSLARAGRGLMDLSAVFADNSVDTYRQVHWATDERMAHAAGYNFGAGWPSQWENVPKR